MKLRLYSFHFILPKRSGFRLEPFGLAAVAGATVCVRRTNRSEIRHAESRLNFHSEAERKTMSSTQPASETPRKYQLFIDGKWVDAESGKTFTTPNPATGATLAEVAEGDKADIDKAVAAARRAFEGAWSKVSARDRGRMMYKLAQLIEARTGDLAALETADNGKPIRETTYVDIPQ